MRQKRVTAQRFAFATKMAGLRRSKTGDFRLGCILAAIAGAANAGGFFALGHYTSHMTGYMSMLADNLVTMDLAIVGLCILAISAFVAGAAFSTTLINWSRLRSRRQQYALPLAVQGFLLLCFAWGGIFSSTAGLVFSLACLSFIMGMQNATITKISEARIRTTHITGLVTDIGIELGRAIFSRLAPLSGVRPDLEKLRIISALPLAFLIGGVIGALGFSMVGFVFSVPLAMVLLGLSVPVLIRNRHMR